MTINLTMPTVTGIPVTTPTVTGIPVTSPIVTGIAWEPHNIDYWVMIQLAEETIITRTSEHKSVIFFRLLKQKKCGPPSRKWKWMCERQHNKKNQQRWSLMRMEMDPNGSLRAKLSVRKSGHWRMVLSLLLSGDPEMFDFLLLVMLLFESDKNHSPRYRLIGECCKKSSLAIMSWGRHLKTSCQHTPAHFFTVVIGVPEPLRLSDSLIIGQYGTSRMKTTMWLYLSMFLYVKISSIITNNTTSNGRRRFARGIWKGVGSRHEDVSCVVTMCCKLINHNNCIFIFVFPFPQFTHNCQRNESMRTSEQ